MENKISETPARPLLWRNILFMTITPVLAAILTPLYVIQFGWSWGLFALFAVLFAVNNMTITCGYHRYFAHRSYEAHPLLEIFYIFVGAGAFQSSVLQWATDHRRHHRDVDTDSDPYTIKKGFLWAHLTWMFFKDPHPEAHTWPKDLAKNRLVMFQHNYYVWVASFMGFIAPGLIAMAFGMGFWGGVIFGGLLRIVLTQHSTFLINSAAHTFGRQTYTDKHTARDSFIMAVLTFGEGYHNYHHSFQADYRNGTRWYQWDPSKWAIGAAALLGLTTKLKRARNDEILKARLAMEERQMLSRGAPYEKIAQLKQQVLEAQKKLRQVHESYLAAKRDWQNDLAARGGQWKELRKAEIRAAKTEFKIAYRQWRELKKASRRAAAV